VGVIGGYAKKYPTRKAHIRRELVLLLWAREQRNHEILRFYFDDRFPTASKNKFT
jgi:hypothetical protein